MIGTRLRLFSGELSRFAAALSLLAPIAACVETEPASSNGTGRQTSQMSLAELCRLEKNNSDKCPRVHGFVEVYDVFLSPMRDSAVDRTRNWCPEGTFDASLV